MTAPADPPVCALPTRHGAPCGEPPASGLLGMPAGICIRHAIRVARAVHHQAPAGDAGQR